jgi:hypothetical protein
VTELIASDEFPTAVPLIGAAEAAEMAARPTTEPANTANNVFLITVLLFLQFAQAASGLLFDVGGRSQGSAAYPCRGRDNVISTRQPSIQSIKAEDRREWNVRNRRTCSNT